jgi:ABC-type nitrate/sulfonate/bicarbonate transport system substrate-binding protein
MISKLKARILGVAVAGAMAATCTGITNASAEPIRVVFPTSPTTAFLPLYVAQKKGWLGDLQIKEMYVTGDSNAIRTILSGNADFGAGNGTFGVISAVGAGAHLMAVGSWSPLPDYNMVLAAGKGTKISDLAGKTFASSGPGALPEQLPRALMRKYHVDASKTRFIQVGGHSARLQAVLAGRADGALVNIVTLLAAHSENKVTVITKIATEFPMLGYVWNVVSSDKLKDPKIAAAAQTLTTAGIRGSRFVTEHPDEAAEILHERVPTIPVDVAKQVVRQLNDPNVWGIDGGLNPEIAKFTADTGFELGTLKKKVDTTKLLDRQFVDVSMKELGPAKKAASK